ncbi:Cytosolic sulfotransferase 15 [Spatholobus suberectus]|nr:Cytosolic sulfotransferase 15 [Spatholobus suberectus]
MASMGEQQANEEDKLILSLPRERGWLSPYLYLFQEFWCPSTRFQAVNNFQKYFQAKDSDIIVASFPKSGTTWLKALTFAIVNHQHLSSLENHPLLTSNSHDLLPFFESTFKNFVKLSARILQPGYEDQEGKAI